MSQQYTPLAALHWAQEMFGPIAINDKERATRFLEEAIELAQAVGVSLDVTNATVSRVYSRMQGDPKKEIAQAMMTLQCLGEVLAVDPIAGAAIEFDRISAIPKSEWQRRHNAKVKIGIANN